MSAPSVADMRAALALGASVSDAAVVDAYVASLGFGISAAPSALPADPWAMAVDVLFRMPGSMAATYTPPGGQPVQIRTIKSNPDVSSRFGQGTVVQSTNLFEIRVSDVALPVSGAVLDTNIGSFSLFGAPSLDSEGLSWRCGAEPA